jgi:hypothetical protein
MDIEDLVSLIYLIGCFIALFPMSYFFAKDFAVGKPDTGDLVAGIAGGFCVCWFWPLAILGVPVYYALKHWE